MKISYNWLQSFFKKKLPAPEKVADLLTMHSFETELVKKVGSDYLLDVDVLPNRAHDCLSHLGIAREIAAITNSKLQIPNYKKNQKSKIKNQNLVKAEIKDKKLCPRYTVRAVVNVRVGSSPKWLQERLEVCGLRPISNIVDIANYVMLEIGQPLHAFDADKLKSKGETKTIIIRRAKKGERITTLDNEKYSLDENILVIADGKNPVCVAGIKGGQDSGIDRQTNQIILEAANFSPQIIRQGSRQLNLETDASWRFEQGLDPNLTEEAVDMAACLIQEIAGGEILDGIVDVYPIETKPKKIKLDIKRVKSLLGVDIPIKEIKSTLERLGFRSSNLETRSLSQLRDSVSKFSKFQIEVPTRRIDVYIPEDLIEEIGRIYGFEKITSQLPTATLIPSVRNEDLIYQSKIRDILSNLGFSEVYNYSFISDKGVEVLNPISREQKYLRPNLAINLIKNIKENKKYFKEVRLFEIGKVFGKNKSKLIEKKKLGVVLLPTDFYRLKGVIEILLNKLRITDVWYNEATGKNIRAEIMIGNNLLGWLGDNIFELDFEKIVKLATEERIYMPPSKYPAIVRDIALLVERGTKVVEALNLINAAGGHLVRDVDLFDMYEGEEIPCGKKNLAFHIIYQSDDYTLTDKEVNKLQEKIINTLEEEGGWEVRR